MSKSSEIYDWLNMAIGGGDKMKTKFTSLFFDKAILYFIFFFIFYVSFISVHTANSDPLDNWHQRGAGLTAEDLEMAQ